MRENPSAIESAVRDALREIQQGGLLCVHPELAERQLEGAVQIVMEHLERRCPAVLQSVSSGDEETNHATGPAGR